MPRNTSKYQLEYYYKNKDALTVKVICDECGKKYQRCSKAQHFKTECHQQAVKINQLQQKLNEYIEYDKKIKQIDELENKLKDYELKFDKLNKIISI